MNGHLVDHNMFYSALVLPNLLLWNKQKHKSQPAKEKQLLLDTAEHLPITETETQALLRLLWPHNSLGKPASHNEDLGREKISLNRQQVDRAWLFVVYLQRASGSRDTSLGSLLLL
uniref:Uncharacterized protein n=1 Tax=Nothoprocta perdicaria TaxID=30464 RepID=A0A8C6ZQ13_NOTPE